MSRSFDASRPTGPKNFLGLGNVKRFSDHTLDFIVELQAIYGDVVKFRMGPFTAFFFYHPDHVKEIVTTHWKKLPKMKRQVKVLQQWDGNGLLLSEGEEWQRAHRLVQPAFAMKRFAAYAGMMNEVTQQRLAEWAKLPAGSEIVIDEQMRRITVEIISKTMFGADLSADVKRIEQAVLALSEISVAEMKMISIPPRWLPTRYNRRKWAAVEYLTQIIDGFIKAKRAKGTDEGDFISMLLLAQDPEGKGGGMTDAQVRDEAMVLFLAGHDTTATNLIWTWYLIAQHPEVEARAVAEIEAVLGGRVPTADDLPKLRYVRQIILESLRLYPPAIGLFARQPTEDLVIGGCPVPKDSFVYAFSYVTHRDPRWFKDPETFDPDRFSPEREKHIPPFAYFPFGGGPRVCIGMQFSLMESTIVVASVLQKFRLKLVPGQNVKPEVRLSLTPKDPIRFTLEKR